MIDSRPAQVPLPPRRRLPSAGTWLTYVLLGAILGGLWLWGGSEPIWEHIVRTGLFVVVVLPASYYGGQWLRARRGKGPLPEIHLFRIIAAKLSLLVVAIIVTLLIEDHTTHTAQIVAAGLFLVIALGGPPFHRFFVPDPARSKQRAAAPR